MKLKLFSLVYIISIAMLPQASFASLRTDPPTGTITGVVTDKADKSPMAGVTVSIPDLKVSTTTNLDGKYTLSNVPNGVYLVQYTFIGYGSITRSIDFSKSGVVDIQMQTSTIETSEVIITGVSKATELKRSPVPMVAVSKEFLEERSASGNVIDEIANLPGISAVTTGPNISKPFIHGLGYNRVITLMDGIRQEGQQWGDEHGIEVDQNSIDRVEVIKGPASLTYGSDAIGGVVNLISPPPVPEGKILGSVQGVYGTNNGLYNGSFRLMGNTGGWTWGTIISAKGAEDYQDQHDGRVWATNFEEKDARVSLGLNKSWGYSHFNASLFDDLQAIPDGSRDPVTRQFTKQISEADLYRPIVTEDELTSYSIPVLHQHVQLYRIYNNSNFNLWGGNLILNLGYQYSHRREFTHPEDATTPGLNLQLTTYTYDVKYDFNIANTIETTIGVNGMYQSNTLGYSTDFPIPAYRQFDVGPFIAVKKTFGKLDLSGGIRDDSRTFNGQAAYVNNNTTYPTLYTGPNPTGTAGVTQQFTALNKVFTGTSGSFGATYNISDQFLMKGNIARGFRAPSIAELSANGADPGSQIYHVGNSNFKPEFSTQEDIGAFLTLPNVSASVELFTNNIQNYIFQEQILDASGNPERVDPDGTPDANGQYSKFTYVQSHARIQGGEASLDIHPTKWLHFENAMSLTYGTNLGTGAKVPDSLKYLPFIPPLHTHSELRGNFAKTYGSFKGLYVFVGFDHFSAQDKFFAAYGTETYTAGYNLVSAGFGGNVVNKAGTTVMSIFIEGTNLGNVNYQSNMSRLKYFDNSFVPAGVQTGIFNMGRNVSFKIVVPFDASPRSKPVTGS